MDELLNEKMTSSESENEADDFVEGLTPYMIEPEKPITTSSSDSEEINDGLGSRAGNEKLVRM